MVQAAQPGQQACRGSRSPMFAAVTATASSRPRQSVTMCRLGPGTFFPPSWPREAAGTVAAARTDCVDDPGRGLGLPSHAFPCLPARPDVELGDRPVLAPTAEEGIDPMIPRRKVRRHRPPGDTARPIRCPFQGLGGDSMLPYLPTGLRTRTVRRPHPWRRPRRAPARPPPPAGCRRRRAARSGAHPRQPPKSHRPGRRRPARRVRSGRGQGCATTVRNR